MKRLPRLTARDRAVKILILSGISGLENAGGIISWNRSSEFACRLWIVVEGGLGVNRDLEALQGSFALKRILKPRGFPGAMLVTTILVIMLMSLPGWSAEEAKAPPPQAEKVTTPALLAKKAMTPSPDPRQILQKMCEFLKSQQQFSYKAEVADDEVYYGGKKLQYEIDLETFVRRPDLLRVNAEGDLIDKQFFFDGKTITLYDKDHNVYGVLEVPPNIESALAKASKNFGVRVALTDLASPDLWELLNKRIKTSLYVGQSKIRGVLCHHLSFDGDKVQLQVWIEAGINPCSVRWC
jgi:hypothetical protein